MHNVQMENSQRKKKHSTILLLKTTWVALLTQPFFHPEGSQALCRAVKINISKIRKKELKRKGLCK